MLKWLLGIIGLTLNGSIGVIIGFMAGAILEIYQKSRKNKDKNPIEFLDAYIFLIAAVINADGKILEKELNYCKEYFKKNFSIEKSEELFRYLNNVLKSDFVVGDACQAINSHLDYFSRLQLINLLLGIAKSDDNFDYSELKIIKQISNLIGITKVDLISAKAMYETDRNAHYRVLGIKNIAEKEEIKKAYRKMAKQYHPDRITHLDTEFKSVTDDNFLKIKQAWEVIKKEKGFR